MLCYLNMVVDKNVAFKNSFALESRASFVVKIESKRDLLEATLLAKKEGLPLFPLGSGTNIVPKPQIEAVVAVLALRGIVKENKTVKTMAGENWDEVVAFATQNNLSGIEALSGIPGTAGAGPIQNIGAYGSEIKDSLVQLEVFDIQTEEFKVLENRDCNFSYRDSIFKQEKGKFVITEITLALSEEKPQMPDYRDVKNYFAEKENSAPNMLEIRKAILEIRKSKLPDSSVIPNCGSFFKNPFVTAEKVKKLKEEFGNVPVFQQNNLFKIPAGFLIDSLGFKGKKIGKIEIYKNNALVLTNPYGATFEDLLFAKSEIERAVFQKFGIKLEAEVNILE